MVRDIQNARRRVWLEAYIVSGDRAGQAMAAALEERAGAGVDVRLMYDAVGSFSTPAEYFADLEQAGVAVHAYHSLGRTLWNWRFFRLFNRRNHRNHCHTRCDKHRGDRDRHRRVRRSRPPGDDSRRRPASGRRGSAHRCRHSDRRYHAHPRGDTGRSR